LAAARAGSGAALGMALETCRNYLLLIAGQHLDADVNAEGGSSELVQETFLEAQRDFARFHGTSEAELLTWLRQILLNHVADFTRRYRGAGRRDINREVAGGDSARPAGTVPAAPTPIPRAAGLEQAETLKQALQRLPDDYRQAVVLRYLEGRSFDDIGKLMNCSPDAARKLWARAMERLRQEWEGAG